MWQPAAFPMCSILASTPWRSRSYRLWRSRHSPLWSWQQPSAWAPASASTARLFLAAHLIRAGRRLTAGIRKAPQNKEDVAMVQQIEDSYSGTELLAVNEHALANYNAWIVKQFVRYFRKGDAAGNVALDFGAGIGTLSVIFERDSGVRPLAVEVDVNQQVALRNRHIETYASLADLP